MKYYSGEANKLLRIALYVSVVVISGGRNRFCESTEECESGYLWLIENTIWRRYVTCVYRIYILFNYCNSRARSVNQILTWHTTVDRKLCIDRYSAMSIGLIISRLLHCRSSLCANCYSYVIQIITEKSSLVSTDITWRWAIISTSSKKKTDVINLTMHVSISCGIFLSEVPKICYSAATQCRRLAISRWPVFASNPG
jgi:hypothetical protein